MNDEQFKKLSEQLMELSTDIKGQGIRLSAIEQRFDSMDQRLDGIEARLNEHDNRFDQLQRDVGRVYEGVQAILDQQKSRSKSERTSILCSIVTNAGLPASPNTPT